MAHGPAHVILDHRKHPILPRRGTFPRQKKKEHRHHEDAGEGDAERDQNSELGESLRARQHQRHEADGRRQRAKENGFTQAFDRFADGRLMIDTFIARLLVTSENQNGKVDSQSDQDRAEPDGHHVELVENQQAGRERHQAAEQQGQTHPDERQPAMESDIKNSSHQENGAE